MKEKRVLVTGGAGFIGSHLVDDLLDEDHEVFVLDSLDEQVHGKRDGPPDYLAKDARFTRGDVRDRETLRGAVVDDDIQVVFHLGASVGIGQSMYEVSKFIGVNALGTANLLDVLANENHAVEKVVVASSNTVYGEGLYECEACGPKEPPFRREDDLRAGRWELSCPDCGRQMAPIPTPETKAVNPTSIYAQSKYYQEQMSLLVGENYGIPTVALRFFNVYGERQALSNPYTGVCAIFSANLLNGNPPTIYEDGNQSRDLVYVKDICQGLVLAMEKTSADYEVFNVGTGRGTTIGKVARVLGEYINPDITPRVTGEFRKGDVRHCIADTKKIRDKLGYSPRYEFDTQVKGFIEWVKQNSEGVRDETERVNEVLRDKGIL
ncbi:MAG: NAD-dependent epimerase/dehydratase family protein [Promethearchaeota archaeon]